VGFRDVFEMDGKPVRDRQERLATLFLKSTSEPLDQALRIASESARFNLNASIEIGRTINAPMTALVFLRWENQPRSTFRLDGVERIGGIECAIVRFTERTQPRLIATNNDSPASGAFWIEPASGRIQRSELMLDTEAAQRRIVTVTVRILVNYADQPELKLWLPVSMDEH